jgi:hypothetical protein
VNRWLEHFFVIPFRWLRVHVRNWVALQQRCKVCGCRDKFDFHIVQDVWQKVVPPRFQNRVVCLACFDDFAKEKEIDYSGSLTALYFAGHKASFQFLASSESKSDFDVI